MTTVKTAPLAQDKNALTAAQLKVRDRLVPFCTADIKARKALLHAVIAEATKTQMPLEGLALAVRAAYVEAGDTDKSAGARASEAKRLIAGLRVKAVTAEDMKECRNLQHAASQCPTLTKGGQGAKEPKAGGDPEKAKAEIAELAAELAVTSTPKDASPMVHLRNIETSLNAIRKCLGAEDDKALGMVADLADLASELADMLAQEFSKAA